MLTASSHLDFLSVIRIVLTLRRLSINETCSAFLLERYQESDEEENSLLNLNIELLDNQYQRILAESMKSVVEEKMSKYFLKFKLKLGFMGKLSTYISG